MLVLMKTEHIFYREIEINYMDPYLAMNKKY